MPLTCKSVFGSSVSFHCVLDVGIPLGKPKRGLYCLTDMTKWASSSILFQNRDLDEITSVLAMAPEVLD